MYYTFITTFSSACALCYQHINEAKYCLKKKIANLLICINENSKIVFRVICVAIQGIINVK